VSKILDIVNSPWALLPEKLDQVVAIYGAYVRGEKIDIAAIEAQLGKPLVNEQPPYEIIDGVAVVPVQGVLSKRMNLLSRISGGASTEIIGRDVRAALADQRVHAIVLDIDSPGGSVDGTQTLADQVFGARAQKPIVAFADGIMTSGAYWIGSAAQEIYLSGNTVITGSIGVATQHVDFSRANDKFGITVTDIYAGKYKRITSENKPLSDEGRAALQAIVDQIYTTFVDDVARNRGVDTDAVLKNMADGKLFVGKAAIEAGLVDGVSTFDALIADLVAGRRPAGRASA
jgi:signal peptide peptidase SppA